MGDAAANLEEDEEGKPQAEPKASSPIVKWLMWVAAALAGLLAVVLISIFVEIAAISKFKLCKGVSA